MLSYLFDMPKAAPSNKLDQLVADYNRYLNSATFVGNDVIYTRNTWDGLREAFTKIIRECVQHKGARELW
jgi:hypothetical protein